MNQHNESRDNCIVSALEIKNSPPVQTDGEACTCYSENLFTIVTKLFRITLQHQFVGVQRYFAVAHADGDALADVGVRGRGNGDGSCTVALCSHQTIGTNRGNVRIR